MAKCSVATTNQKNKQCLDEKAKCYSNFSFSPTGTLENYQDDNGEPFQKRPPQTCLTNPWRNRDQRAREGGRRRRLLPYSRASWAISQKNALVHLNELRPGLHYEPRASSGPLHAPLFSVAVEVDGRHFEGCGPTVKRAKLRAAESALRSFVQFPNTSQAQATLGESSGLLDDFSADVPGIVARLPAESQPLLQENYAFLHGTKEVKPSGLTSSTNPKRSTLNSSPLPSISPTVLLNQLWPGLRYTCLTERLHGQAVRSFVMVLRLKGKVFEGCGRSKRSARQKAAAAALRAICNLGPALQGKVLEPRGSGSDKQLPQVSRSGVRWCVCYIPEK